MSRNISILRILEKMKIRENRYSCIPTIRKYMEKASLDESVFLNERSSFKAILYKKTHSKGIISIGGVKNIFAFFKEAKSREEITNYLGFKTSSYVMTNFINQLVEKKF